MPTTTPTGTVAPPVILHHFHLNHLGSTEAITDNAGQLIEQIRYSAYGEIRGRWDGGGSPIATSGQYEFTGYETDPTSNLEYANARFFDPSMGSFLSHDPAAEFVNPYSYVHWDPVNNTDPTGAFAELIPAIVIALAFGTINGVRAAESSSTGHAVENGILGAVSIAAYALPVLGVAFSAGSTAANSIIGAEIAAGAFSTAEGFRNGQYVAAGLGATLLAYSAYELLNGTANASPPKSEGPPPVASQVASDDGGSCQLPAFEEPPDLMPEEQPDWGQFYEGTKELNHQLESYRRDFGYSLVQRANDDIAALPGGGPGRMVQGYILYEQGQSEGLLGSQRVLALSYPGLPEPETLPLWNSTIKLEPGLARIGYVPVILRGAVPFLSAPETAFTLPIATTPADLGLSQARLVFPDI